MVWLHGPSAGPPGLCEARAPATAPFTTSVHLECPATCQVGRVSRWFLELVLPTGLPLAPCLSPAGSDTPSVPLPSRPGLAPAGGPLGDNAAHQLTFPMQKKKNQPMLEVDQMLPVSTLVF